VSPLKIKIPRKISAGSIAHRDLIQGVKGFLFLWSLQEDAAIAYSTYM
jgi:hypothetical protein